MAFKVSGKVLNLDSGEGLPGVTVRVMDKDLFYDDPIGKSHTDADGFYCFEYTEENSKGLFEEQPDIYLVVEGPDGQFLGTTSDDIRSDVERDIRIDIHLPHGALVGAGIAEPKPAVWMEKLDQREQEVFTNWSWQPEADDGDELAATLREELSGKSSVLELIKEYNDALKGTADNDAEPFRKLAKLFELGIAPREVEGHFYGFPVGIRTGDLSGTAAECGNVLGFLWGVALQGASPWVGKSLTPVTLAERENLVQGHIDSATRLFKGINHFNRLELRPLNVASFSILSWWMGLKEVSEAEKATFGNDRNGGDFVACSAPSVYHGTRREVFQLNYRWPGLKNLPPFRWLVDELVQIAEGFYLGQLLFATRRLLSDFDSQRPTEDYRYQHFGYFVLFDGRWNREARRLLPHLEVPVTVPGMVYPQVVPGKSEKFTTFTFENPSPPNADGDIMAEIHNDMKRMPTIMHLFKHYSDELQDSLDNESPLFLKLQELFNRGIGMPDLKGRFRGALVSWHAEGLTRYVDVNTLNLAWMRVGRNFSTWTGKTFEAISTAKLAEITDGHESGEQPTVWGSNTQALRTQHERFVGKLMKLAGVWSEVVPDDEAREFGYDLKNFFFIAKQNKSVNRHNKGKDIFQFNYRWPKLKNIIPDCYCIDELVQVADNLYLGQLMYATEPLKPYSPDTDSGEYKYRLFGYFLLMDDTWHRLRLDIGFDLENS